MPKTIWSIAFIVARVVKWGLQAGGLWYTRSTAITGTAWTTSPAPSSRPRFLATRRIQKNWSSAGIGNTVAWWTCAGGGNPCTRRNATTGSTTRRATTLRRRASTILTNRFRANGPSMVAGWGRNKAVWRRTNKNAITGRRSALTRKTGVSPLSIRPGNTPTREIANSLVKFSNG